MQELTNLVVLDDQIAKKETALKSALARVDLLKIELGIESLKAEIEALKVEKESVAIAGASIIQEVGKIQIDGIEFGIQKGKESVHIKEDCDLEKVPREFVTVSLSPNKREIAKAHKVNPEAITAFAKVVRAPDKLVYKVV